MTTIQRYRDRHVHRYRHDRRKPSVCVHCGVKRRSAKDRNGRWRRAVDDRSGRWQYQAPCQRETWQYQKLPCAVVCGERLASP